MKLSGIELVRVEIPFVQDIGTAVGVHRTRSMLFVRVVADEGEGWGECAALSDATSVDPAVDEVEEAAETRGVSRLDQRQPGPWRRRSPRGPRWPSSSGTRRRIGSWPRPSRWRSPTPSCASAGRSMAPGARSRARVRDDARRGGGRASRADRDVDVLRRQVDAVVASGISRVRMKIEPGWEVAPVAAIRADHGDLVLQVDANGSFDGHRGRRRSLEPPGRVRRAVCGATPAAGRSHRPRRAGQEAAAADLPRRIADLAAPGAGRAAQRCLRHGLPQAGPTGRRPGHPGRPRRLPGGRGPQLRRRVLRGRPRALVEPGPGGAPGPGRDGPGQ